MKLEPEALRWECPRDWFDFETTAEIEPSPRIEGQPDAVESLSFGLHTRARGHNVFVRGLSGTGRMTLLTHQARKVPPIEPQPQDSCYVHNFQNPHEPQLIQVPRGQAPQFKSLMDRFIRFVREDLSGYLKSERVNTQRVALENRTQQAMQQLGQPFESELSAQGLAMVPMQAGNTMIPAIVPVIDGKPVSSEEFSQLRASGKLSEDAAQQIIDRINQSQGKLQHLSQEMMNLQEQHREKLRDIYESEARLTVHNRLEAIDGVFDDPAMTRFLTDVEEDLVTQRLSHLDNPAFTRMYEVNVMTTHAEPASAPIVVERNPTVSNLFGDIESIWTPQTGAHSDHMMINGGSILAADGGFILIDARDLLSEPGAWHQLVRCLRAGEVNLGSQEVFGFVQPALKLKPEPLPVDVKVVLVGDAATHYLLDAYDPHFPQLFKVLADFSDSTERNREGAAAYAGIIARIINDECLLPFSRDAVAAITEHGARVSAEKGRLSLRFGRLADIVREAGYIAQHAGREVVDGDDVSAAIRAGRRRADLPVRRFRRMIKNRDIRIDVSGSVVGQINGLAISSTGPLTYGFPARITATIGAGTGGTVNVEREANLSGAIHTKGFQILSGLMRHLLRVDHPLAFTASVAFEQSYGGIDGDSASGAEICAVLSALTDVPLRQDLAMTGAIDQKGHILPIGGATEKAEGFYDTCVDLGITGTQGVIIPAANADELTLRRDVVAAAREEQFHVYAVSTIHEALALLTGLAVPERGSDGYAEGSLLALAERRIYYYWQLLSQMKSLPGTNPEDGPSGSGTP